jgi:hypothetical protein
LDGRKEGRKEEREGGWKGSAVILQKITIFSEASMWILPVVMAPAQYDSQSS